MSNVNIVNAQAAPIGEASEKAKAFPVNALSGVLEALAGLSNREVLQVLKAAAAINNLRVLPMDRPIGLSTGPAPIGAGKEKERKGPNKVPPPPKKRIVKDIVLDGLQAERLELLLKLKAQEPDNNQAELDALRRKEGDIKERREALRTKQQPP